jgi:serine/threonine protein kinase
MREISILTELQHPNIVGLKDVVMTDTYIYFVQEFCNRDLRNHIMAVPEGQNLSAREIKSIIYQILEGVRECHETRIVHRDLKPANVLLAGANNEIIKLADFGLARAFSIPIKPYTKDVVTLWYRCPELLMQFNEYATPIDLWSVGCIFAELAMKDALFKGQNEMQQLMEIFRILGTPTEETWPGISQTNVFKQYKWPMMPKMNLRDFIGSELVDDLGLDLLWKMLEYDPTKRITAR